MHQMALVALLLAGCDFKVFDCVDFGGGCEPPALTLSSRWTADNRNADGVAIDGAYLLSVAGGYGEVALGGADHVRVESIDDATGTAVITLRGRSVGDDHLGIRRDESTAVHWIEVRALERVDLMPREMAFAELDEPPPHAVLAGSDTQLVVRLFSADGERLVDHRLTVEADGGQLTPTDWDAFRIDSETAVTVDVMAADRAYGFTVPVVTDIQDIVPVSGGRVSDIRALTPGSRAQVCFAGVLAGLQVAGLDWEIKGEGVSIPNNASLAAGGCAYVDRPQDGQVLTVRAGSLERTFTLATAP